MSATIRNSIKLAVVLALLTAHGCKHSSASDTVVQTLSTQANKNEAKAIGCHPTDASESESGSLETEPTTADHSTAIKTNGMVFIKGGSFLMGSDDGLPVEAPVHRVNLTSFWMDQHEVTADQFAEFVRATGYRTDAEKFGWAGVFDVRAGAWKKVNEADWRHPDGPDSAAAPDEPVTQVSWTDAAAYASWAKKRLPTEAEFEYAARGGLVGKRYTWGDELRPSGKYLANWWQGTFPVRNLGEDGFVGRARVGSFPPNGNRLYDMAGNVWEWCSDWFQDGYYVESPRDNPSGPTNGEARVIRGGSWLCSDNYCTGYRVAARNKTTPDTGLNNLGFRCVKN